MKRLLPVLVCLLAGKSVFAEAPETPQQELARAEVLERNHKHAEALALARKAAEAGLAEAWYWIGMNTTDADPAAFVKAAGLGYAPAFPFALDGVLFRAGHKADVTQAKHLADLARSRHVNLGYDSAAELQTIDRCFQAGEPNIPTKLSKDELALYSRPGTDCSVYRTGVGAANNYGKYLRCLLAQSPDDMNALAEIYANGWGVARDVKLAISLQPAERPQWDATHTLGPALARSAYNESHDDSGPLADADSPPASRILGRPDLDLGRTGSLSDPGRDSVLVRKAVRLAVAIVCAGDRGLRGRAVSRDGVSAQCSGSCGRWNRAVVSRAENVGIAPPAHSRCRLGAGRAYVSRPVFGGMAEQLRADGLPSPSLAGVAGPVCPGSGLAPLLHPESAGANLGRIRVCDFPVAGTRHSL
jgi:hypothetical protein